MHLADPDVQYEAAYLSYMAELGDQPRIPFPLSFPAQPFSGLVSRLHAASRGIGIPEEFVANTTYWLMRGDRMLAVSNLRHALTPALYKCGGHIGYGVRPSDRGLGIGKEILRQTLIKALSIGINRALLTCAKDNSASSRVILANGGVLENEVIDPQTGKVTLRYWINLNTTG